MPGFFSFLHLLPSDVQAFATGNFQDSRFVNKLFVALRTFNVILTQFKATRTDTSDLPAAT